MEMAEFSVQVQLQFWDGAITDNNIIYMRKTKLKLCY